MEYNVRFGRAFSVDQFGFVYNGEVCIDSEDVIFIGKKRWSFLAKLCVFLFLTVVPLVLFGIGLGWILALVIIHYYCVSDGSIAIKKSSVSDIRRKGRWIRFMGKHPESGKQKNTVFKVETKEEAAQLEQELKN